MCSFKCGLKYSWKWDLKCGLKCGLKCSWGLIHGLKCGLKRSSKWGLLYHLKSGLKYGSKFSVKYVFTCGLKCSPLRLIIFLTLLWHFETFQTTVNSVLIWLPKNFSFLKFQNNFKKLSKSPNIFKNSPQFACHSNKLLNPNDRTNRPLFLCLIWFFPCKHSCCRHRSKTVSA